MINTSDIPARLLIEHANDRGTRGIDIPDTSEVRLRSDIGDESRGSGKIEIWKPGIKGARVRRNTCGAKLLDRVALEEVDCYSL